MVGHRKRNKSKEVAPIVEASKEEVKAKPKTAKKTTKKKSLKGLFSKSE